ncbi:hypothetical protein IV500_20440 [Paeniglutamicibacter antarcticus]|uniref:Uncharacterized protein n=1 Tax=Arthrobacter terrae TaxID=2935737 RepID=A0A931CVJ0_9MICC|nr:hypothetical protein [Arthrobacter terrae]MBG0741729.1 hypothetical protein [Arthrobacter terrae]
MLDDLTGDEELTDFPEVSGRHRSDEREMPAEVFYDLDGMTIVVTAVGHEILADLPKPCRDTGRHRRLHTGFVAVEFVNDYGRDQQLYLALAYEYPQSHDPALSVSTLRKVETCGGVDEEVQHEVSLRGAFSYVPIVRSQRHKRDQVATHLRTRTDPSPDGGRCSPNLLLRS